MTAVQPTSWMTFSTAGRYDPRIPSAPRVLTIEGTPCRLPITPPSAIGVLPMTWPSRIASRPPTSPSGASRPPAQISPSEMAAPAQSRKKSNPHRFRSVFSTGAMSDTSRPLLRRVFPEGRRADVPPSLPSVGITQTGSRGYPAIREFSAPMLAIGTPPATPSTSQRTLQSG